MVLKARELTEKEENILVKKWYDAIY